MSLARTNQTNGLAIALVAAGRSTSPLLCRAAPSDRASSPNRPSLSPTQHQCRKLVRMCRNESSSSGVGQAPRDRRYCCKDDAFGDRPSSVPHGRARNLQLRQGQRCMLKQEPVNEASLPAKATVAYSSRSNAVLPTASKIRPAKAAASGLRRIPSLRKRAVSAPSLVRSDTMRASEDSCKRTPKTDARSAPRTEESRARRRSGADAAMRSAEAATQLRKARQLYNAYDATSKNGLSTLRQAEALLDQVLRHDPTCGQVHTINA